MDDLTKLIRSINVYLDYRNKTYKLVRDGDEWEIISNDVRSIMDGFRRMEIYIINRLIIRNY